MVAWGAGVSPKKRKKSGARLHMRSAGDIKDQDDKKARGEFFRSVKKYQNWPRRNRKPRP